MEDSRFGYRLFLVLKNYQVDYDDFQMLNGWCQKKLLAILSLFVLEGP